MKITDEMIRKAIDRYEHHMSSKGLDTGDCVDRASMRKALEAALESANEVVSVPLDLDALRDRLHELDNKEVGQVIAMLLSVLIDRGINLNSFLPALASGIANDHEIAASLRTLGERR